MNQKPIGPKLHGALDYGLSALQIAVPTLLKLNKKARTVSYAFAGTQGLINTFTDHSLGVKPLIPFKLHGQLEAPFIPALLVLPWATGALKKPKARIYFFALFGIALTNFLLTDYQANERFNSTDLD